MTIWFDVEDIFDYASHASRPSGIQRLAFEIYQATLQDGTTDVGFLRHARAGRGFVTLPVEHLNATYRGMIEPKAPLPRAAAPTRGRAIIPKGLQPLARRVPLDVRAPIGHAARAQVAVFRSAWQAVAAAAARCSARVQRASSPAAPEGVPLRDVVKPGDVLCCFGSPWFDKGYHLRVREAKAELGMRVAILAYDLIPVVRPEYVQRDLAVAFGEWWQENLPLADRLFAISRATADDVEHWSAKLGLDIARPVIPLPIGTGFSDQSIPDAAAQRRIVEGDYALFVSTIEPRKNHDLAFRVWRNLLSQMPRDRVPTLVFAGRVGWMSGDLMQRIENAHHLDGKLKVVQDPSDGDLVSLYRHCSFTLFPSFYEGWGLPVTESLGFGKTCIASDRASVPEAGGSLCIYIDPDNVTGATATIRAAIEDGSVFRRLEDRIRAEFRPTPWVETARAMLSHL